MRRRSARAADEPARGAEPRAQGGGGRGAAGSDHGRGGGRTRRWRAALMRVGVCVCVCVVERARLAAVPGSRIPTVPPLCSRTRRAAAPPPTP
eukprot:5265714-Prymnesium_polylepis.2